MRSSKGPPKGNVALHSPYISSLAKLVLTAIFAYAALRFGVPLSGLAEEIPRPDPPQQRGTNVHSHPDRGDKTFAASCSGCHGLDGKGGERAPNIADRPSVQRLSDAQIFRIIENGVPGTGMPAFHSFKSVQINAVVAHLRTLQGARKILKLPGNAELGKQIFFGKAECSRCHMVAGEGGFIASDLSRYAGTHTVEQIRTAIVEPSLSKDRQVRLVTAIVHGGEKYVGRIRNEDNFSLQLQALDGSFYLLSKSDLDGLEFKDPLMPADYASRLTPEEINGIVSYLISLAYADTAETPKKVSEED